MRKICIIGHFGFGKVLLNGQTIKTKIITEEIETQFGKDNIVLLDLAGGIKRIPYLFFKIPFVLSKCDNLIMMPVENGLKFLTPLLSIWNSIFKRKLHYVVIGGWLPKFISDKKWLKKGLRKFRGIYVETNTMRVALEKDGFNNVFVLPNCKKLNILPKDQLVYPVGVPLKLCTFSRVMKEKGIGTAVQIIKKVNDKLGYTAFSLDIYGQIWEDSKDWFNEIQRDFPEYVSYKGCVEANNSVEVLQDYYALLFPTHFYTEGIPGTIIDAYAAGIPVISAKWESYTDVIDDGITGIGYKFDDLQAFEDVLIKIASNPKMLLNMKINCIEKAKKYVPETAMKVMAEKFGGGVTSSIL